MKKLIIAMSLLALSVPAFGQNIPKAGTCGSTKKMIRDLSDNGYDLLFLGEKNTRTDPNDDTIVFAFINRKYNSLAVFESRGSIESDRQCTVTNAINVKFKSK